MDQQPIQVALLGCGTVGSEVARYLDEHAGDLHARVGRPLQLAGIAVRDLSRRRPGVDPDLLTTHAEELVGRADIVVELMGGLEPAGALIRAAIDRGASVVTANKALLAQDGPSLYTAAAEKGVDLLFEAAVAGAIPIVRPLRESLSGDRVRRVIGIVNGTTNYVLDQMDTHGSGYQEALAQAQRLGYAEADPTADVDGHDAAAKVAIIASLAFHSRVVSSQVYCEGIGGVTAKDMSSAATMGMVVKLLGVAEQSADGRSIRAWVAPAMISRDHPLASVREAFNAVFVEADAAGELMFYGRGAGGSPTASAVLGDLVTVARNRARGAVGSGESSYADLPVAPLADYVNRFHVMLQVPDRPGVLAQVAGHFADHGVSIETVRQQLHPSGEAELVLVTHEATESAMGETVQALRDSDVVDSVVSLMRVVTA
jgi:homoserine dehydrogenase